MQYVRPAPSATLYDVATGKVSMRRFVAGLSVTQPANLVEGATRPGSTPAAVGAAGYTTAKYAPDNTALTADQKAAITITNAVAPDAG